MITECQSTRSTAKYYLHLNKKINKQMTTENRLFVSPIADRLASDKMSNKLIKLIKKGMKDKMIHRGVKETVKAVRKGKKG